MSQPTIMNRTLALAGVCQATLLVSQIARKGECDDAMLETLLQSILITHPDRTEDVYGGIECLKPGLAQLVQQLDPNSRQKNMDVTRYAVALLALEARLRKRPAVFDQLAQRISQLQRQSDHFELLSEHSIKNFASVYSDIISPAGPRIQIAGAANVLQIGANQDRIRAALLAGVRSAVLWRQLGGSRLQFLLSRSKLLQAARAAESNI